MELVPFKKIVGVPTGIAQGNADVLSEHEFIDISSMFLLNPVRGIRRSNYRGISGYMFDARLLFSFNKNYKIQALEFRLPFAVPAVDGLFLKGVNIFQPTLNGVHNILKEMGVEMNKIDVGLEAPSIGVSFFSNDFEDILMLSLMV